MLCTSQKINLTISTSIIRKLCFLSTSGSTSGRKTINIRKKTIKIRIDFGKRIIISIICFPLSMQIFFQIKIMNFSNLHLRIIITIINPFEKIFNFFPFPVRLIFQNKTCCQPVISFSLWNFIIQLIENALEYDSQS